MAGRVDVKRGHGAGVDLTNRGSFVKVENGQRAMFPCQRRGVRMTSVNIRRKGWKFSTEARHKSCRVLQTVYCFCRFRLHATAPPGVEFRYPGSRVVAFIDVPVKNRGPTSPRRLPVYSPASANSKLKLQITPRRNRPGTNVR